MGVVYLLLGLSTALIAAAPPGAANIVVINTALKENMKKVLYLALGAGIGELVLSLIALHCTMSFLDFFQNNSWVQITTFSLFILVGVYFLILKYVPKRGKEIIPSVFPASKFVKGFLLAFINPPVLIFWVLTFTFLDKFSLGITGMSPLSTLALFFSGVYLGKFTTLYFYGRWGTKLGQKKDGKGSKKEIFIGTALVLVGLIQGAKFFIS